MFRSSENFATIKLTSTDLLQFQNSYTAVIELRDVLKNQPPSLVHFFPLFRQIMEARHSGHYAIFNLCERKYSPMKFPNGKLIDPDWTSLATPSIEQVLDTAMRALEFLGRNNCHFAERSCLQFVTLFYKVISGISIFRFSC